MQVVVLCLTEAELCAREAKKEAERVARFHAQVGARAVFKALCGAKKPIVVHNGEEEEQTRWA
jgi:hypothetical protein